MQPRHPRPPEALSESWPPFATAAIADAPALSVDRGTQTAGMPSHSIERVLVSEAGDFIAIGRLPAADEGVDVTDALFLAEFVRHAIEVIARSMLGMQPEDVFVLKSIALHCSDDLAGYRPNAASRAIIILPGTGVRRRPDRSAYAADGPVYCYLDSHAAAAFGGTVAFLTPDHYAVLRRADGDVGFGFPRGHVEPLVPSCLGKLHQRDVLIGCLRRRRAGLTAKIVPQAPQAFFDRPLDHYPGMMMAEAARQLAIRSASLSRENLLPHQMRVTSIRMTFNSFAELDRPPFLHAAISQSREGGQTILVQARQGRNERARFDIDMSFIPKNGGAG